MGRVSGFGRWQPSCDPRPCVPARGPALVLESLPGPLRPGAEGRERGGQGHGARGRARGFGFREPLNSTTGLFCSGAVEGLRVPGPVAPPGLQASAPTRRAQSSGRRECALCSPQACSPGGRGRGEGPLFFPPHPSTDPPVLARRVRKARRACEERDLGDRNTQNPEVH